MVERWRDVKKRVTFTLEETLMSELKKISNDTMIPQARIVELAIKKELQAMLEREGKRN